MRLRLAALVVALAALAGCTPAQAIDVTFARWHGPRVAEQARAVAGCESGRDGRSFDLVNPTAVSPTNDHGLFQINIVHRAQFTRVTGQPWSAVYDPFWNAVYAKWLYDQQGWSPWTCARKLGLA